MKKDSFTFSDKLKKSKTLPLSKRIPSRVGGEVKAKRTLFERAQRDLPFIIVAALALLLLPFLSRESGDIDTPKLVWGEGDTYEEDFNSKPKSAEEEIALSSFRNPLDLIIRRGEKDSSRDTIDPYASESDSSASEAESSSDKYGSSRSSYASEDYTSSPSTSKYGKTVKRSVRNSVKRVPTAIGSLTTKGMVSANGGGSPNHSLAFGSRSKDAAPRVQGPGVRPVALQPLTAAGKGRDLTGNDALYAEAARSIGAMNRPGAKQALMDAQLADLDGKPLGDTKSAEAKGEPGRPGAGGGPSNNWTHNNQKPWWWDMMKERSQRRWELWHYNWEKMASDSLIALTRGLASCLITGSNNFEVSKFLGADGGDADGKCVDDNGNEVYIRRRQYINELKVSGGKDSAASSVSALPWEEACVKYGHGKVEMKPSGSHKSMLETRLNCLGIGLSDIKDKYVTKRAFTCQGTYYDPMYVNIDITRNGKDKPGKYKKVGYYVMGEKDGCTGDVALFLSKAKSGKNNITGVDRSKVSKIVIYKANDKTTTHYPEGNVKTTDRNLEDYKYKQGDREGEYFDDEEIYWESGDYDKAFNVAYKRIQNGECLTEKELQKILKAGKWRDANTLGVCDDIAFNNSYYKLVKINPLDSTQDDYQSTGNTPNDYTQAFKDMTDCQYKDVFIEKVPSNHVFATTIKNPGKRTIAFVLEYVQGNAYSDDKAPSYFDNEKSTLSERTGYRVVRKIDYTNYPHLVSNNADGSQTFIGEVQVGTSSTLKNDNTERDEKVKAEPGFGKVIWVTTDDMTTEGVTEGTIVREPQANLLFPTPRKLSAVCNYRWGCKGGNVCPGTPNPNEEQIPTEDYCFVADGNNPSNTSLRKYYKFTYFQGHPVKSDNNAILPGDLPENFDEDHAIECEPICKCKDDKYRLIIKKYCEDITGKEIDITDCEECKENEGDGLCELEGEVYKSIKVVENGKEYYFRLTNTPVEGRATVPCTPICADKAKALGILQTTGKDSNIPLNETTLTTEEKVNKQGIGIPSEVCPYCSGKCYIGNEVYPCTSFEGNDGTTYYIRTSATPIAGRTEFPCTPICAKKAEDLGISIFKTKESDPVTPIDPVLTEDANKIAPVKPGAEKLCPFCNPDPESPVAPNPEPRDLATLASRTINFANGCYKKYYIDSNYDFNEFKEAVIDNAVAQGVNTFIIEGHASGRVAKCPEGNCNELLAYDRAIYLYNQMAPLLNGVYNVELIDETDKSKFGTGKYPTPGTNGLPNYEDCENHWPIERNTLMSISYDSSKPTIKITLRGLGISESVTSKQSSGETKEEAKINIRRGEDDRSAIIYPNQEIVDSD